MIILIQSDSLPKGNPDKILVKTSLKPQTRPKKEGKGFAIWLSKM